MHSDFIMNSFFLYGKRVWNCFYFLEEYLNIATKYGNLKIKSHSHFKSALIQSHPFPFQNFCPHLNLFSVLSGRSNLQYFCFQEPLGSTQYVVKCRKLSVPCRNVTSSSPLTEEFNSPTWTWQQRAILHEQDQHYSGKQWNNKCWRNMLGYLSEGPEDRAEVGRGLRTNLFLPLADCDQTFWILNMLFSDNPSQCVVHCRWQHNVLVLSPWECHWCWRWDLLTSLTS